MAATSRTVSRTLPADTARTLGSCSTNAAKFFVSAASVCEALEGLESVQVPPGAQLYVIRIIGKVFAVGTFTRALSEWQCLNSETERRFVGCLVPRPAWGYCSVTDAQRRRGLGRGTSSARPGGG